MCIVAFAGQNLQHLGHLLTAALFGAPVHSEPDVCSVTGKLPPRGETQATSDLLYEHGTGGSLPTAAGGVVPQKAAGGLNVIFQLEDGAAADGHAAVVLNLDRVLNIVQLGHRSAVLDLQQCTTQPPSFRGTTLRSRAAPPVACSVLSPWFCSEGLHRDRSRFLRTPQEAALDQCVYATLPASYL